MITKLGKARSDDRGNTGIAVIVASPFLLTMMLLLVSAQQYWDANRVAQATAAEAARIGAQSDSDNVRVDGFSSGAWQMSPTAAANARTFVEDSGGDVVDIRQQGDRRVRAEVSVDVDYIFPVNLLPDKAEGEAEAVVILGVEEGITP